MMFERLNRQTRDALEAIDTGQVHWTTIGITPTIRFYQQHSDNYLDFTYLDFTHLNERFYHREGWEDRDLGPVTLTAAGREELATLRQDPT
jgi:hypothetical protein